MPGPGGRTPAPAGGTPAQWVLLLVVLGGAAGGLAWLTSDQPRNTDSISGRVVSEDGRPEAGVWVIAESYDVMYNGGRVGDMFRKIVVTDDRGRFVIPDLPFAPYDVWVRGYGLVDGNPAWATTGIVRAWSGTRDIEIHVATAVTPEQQAQVYPASYWASLLEVPAADGFSDDGAHPGRGSGAPADWVARLKRDCLACHQLGNYSTRLPDRLAFQVELEMPSHAGLIPDPSARAALLDALGDWGERIQAGQMPQSPPRPAGIERNVVITQWEVGDQFTSLHGTSVTPRESRQVFAEDREAGWLYALDPERNSWARRRVPVEVASGPAHAYGLAGFDGGAGRATGDAAATDRSGAPDLDVAGARDVGAVSPVDASVWSILAGSLRIQRYDRWTGAFETYEPPYGHTPTGIDVDSDGLVWVAFGSGHLARFDRDACTRTAGSGERCSGGWTLWRVPGPSFAGSARHHAGQSVAVDQPTHLSVDRLDSAGFGKDAVILNGSESDALFVFDPETETFATLRVPFPLGFYTRDFVARIDRPRAGWKGRGVWASYNSSTHSFTESRRPAMVRIQIRPHPLAE